MKAQIAAVKAANESFSARMAKLEQQAAVASGAVAKTVSRAQPIALSEVRE